MDRFSDGSKIGRSLRSQSLTIAQRSFTTAKAADFDLGPLPRLFLPLSPLINEPVSLPCRYFPPDRRDGEGFSYCCSVVLIRAASLLGSDTIATPIKNGVPLQRHIDGRAFRSELIMALVIAFCAPITCQSLVMLPYHWQYLLYLFHSTARTFYVRVE